MSAKDLCLINNVKDLINSGLYSMKIEGRMKTEHYLATVVNAYRKTIDATYNNKSANVFIKDVNKAANRETSVG
jgi:putative protease